MTIGKIQDTKCCMELSLNTLRAKNTITNDTNNEMKEVTNSE